MDNNQFAPPAQEVMTEPTMDFPQAMKRILEGFKVTRIGWHNTDYGFLATEGITNGWLSIYKNGEFFIWKINDGDMKATDWIIAR